MKTRPVYDSQAVTGEYTGDLIGFDLSKTPHYYDSSEQKLELPAVTLQWDFNGIRDAMKNDEAADYAIDAAMKAAEAFHLAKLLLSKRI